MVKMYQAIISKKLLQLLQQFNGDLQKIPKEKSGDVKFLVQLIKKGEINFEPIFPGINDAEMARYYKVSFVEKPTPTVIKKMQKCTAFESFYEKPSDELPT